MKTEGDGQFVLVTQNEGISVLKSLQSTCILMCGVAWKRSQQKPLENLPPS